MGDPVRLGPESSHELRQLRLRLEEPHPLGLDAFEDLCVVVDGADPHAQRAGGARDLANLVGNELGVVDVPDNMMSTL